MTTVTQGSIPEVVERTIGESLDQRTSILGNVADLGPPDMVHLAKGIGGTAGKPPHPTVGTFFYYTGADVSNSATVSALLSHLASIIGEKPQLWFGKHKPFKVSQATYCAYNAFSGVDARVSVGFPGAIESKMIDAAGKEVGETDKLWLETFVSGMVRSLITADNDSADFAAVVEVRRINPVLSKEVCELFMTGFEQLFFEGAKLGCSEDLQIPTNVNNYLVDAFLKCVELTGEFDRASEILARLQEIDSSVAFLEARLSLLGDEEVKAVKIMHEAIQLDPLDGELLSLQAEYCLKKNRLDLALPIATRAVNSSPSYFKPWSILVQIYIKLGQYERALLTLNSCPMVTHKDKYSLKRINNPRPEDMHLPLPVDVTLDKVSTLNSVDVAMEHNKVDPNLVNLPAANLKSTFASAYNLLTQIVRKTGWEKLLKYRTKVFVMEEEFKNNDGGATGEEEKEKREGPSESAIDELDESTEPYHPDASSAASDGSANGAAPPQNGTHTHVKKLPEATLADEESKSRRPSTTAGDVADFKNKRLCERWLDNLFMLLYDDLRVYTMYKAEVMHFDAQQVELKKSTLEWELTGLVAFRLGHKTEAVRCFGRGLSQRFAPRSARMLLDFYTEERINAGDSKTEVVCDDKILSEVVKLLVWNHRWYCSFSPKLIDSLRDLVREVGRVKVGSEVKVRFDDGNVGVSALVQDNLDFLDQYSLIEKEEF